MSQKEEQGYEIGWKKELLEKEVEKKEPSPKSHKATKYHKLSEDSESSSSSNTSSGSGSESSDNELKKKKKDKRGKKEKYKQEKKIKREKRKLEKAQRREIKKAKKDKRKEERRLKKLAKTMKNNDQDDCAIPIDLMYAKAQAPETREEYEARQSQIRRVLDPVSGRTRLIKGDGEILEEIVNREQHKEINKRATQGDGDFFQSKTVGWKFP